MQSFPQKCRGGIATRCRYILCFEALVRGREEQLLTARSPNRAREAE